MRVSRLDVRRAVRALTRRRAFTTVAVLSIALAIALDTVMFSALDALINPRVDMHEPNRLYVISYYGDYRQRISQETKNDLLRNGLGRVFRSLTSHQAHWRPYLVEHGNRFHEAPIATVAPDFFAMVGVHPLQGRLFTDADLAGDARPAIISERLARQLFPGERSPVGQSITIDGDGYTVVGMLSRESDFPPGRTDVWRLPLPPARVQSLPLNLGRLRDGVTEHRAAAYLAVLSGQLALEAGELPRDTRFYISPATSAPFHYQGFHFALIAAVVAVLLIACVNLANLQLARGIARARELATRAAIGASRADLVAHLLVESAVIAGAGLALGLILTLWGIHFVSAVVPPSVGDYIVQPQTSWRVFAFAVVAACVCLVLVGLVPALRVSKVDLNDLLKSGAGTGATKRGRRQYATLVVVEIGLALALLSGAMLLVRAAGELRNASFGFDPKPQASGAIIIAPPRAAERTTRSDHARLLVDHLRQVSSIGEVAVDYWMRAENDTISSDDPSGTPVQRPAPLFNSHIVTPGFFRTYRIAVVRGRDFEEGEERTPSVIVDERMARFLWPNSDAVGRLIKIGSAASPAPWLRVIGVSRSVHFNVTLAGDDTLARRQGVGEIFALAGPDTTPIGRNGAWMSLIVRARRSPERLSVDIRRSLRAFPWLTLFRAGSYEDAVGLTTMRANHNFVAAVFAVFAALALALAAFGVYAIAAHAVAQRTREFGVRIALGAAPAQLARLVLRDNNLLALAGIAVGLVLTASGVRLVRGFLFFEDDIYDSLFFAAIALLLYASAVAAALIPAIRAARVDATEALRSD